VLPINSVTSFAILMVSSLSWMDCSKQNGAAVIPGDAVVG
jgi:hypothetical protein